MSKTVKLEIVSGAEGKALYICDDHTCFRLSGPKPWGGGKTIISFKVDADELIEKIKFYESDTPTASQDSQG